MSVSSQTAAPPTDDHDPPRGFSWRRQVCRVQCLALSIAAALLCAGPAWSRPVDTGSAKVALTADRQFLRSLVNAEPAETASARSYVASIAQQCPGVLSGLAPAAVAMHTSAVVAVVAEGIGDIDLAANVPGRGALAAFARRTIPLSWSSPTTDSDVHHFFAAEDALYHMPLSDLCADAGALATDSDHTAPLHTLQWLTTFKDMLRAATHADRAFELQLTRLSGLDAVPVIATNEQLTQRLQTHEQKLLQSSVTGLMAALGLPTSVRVQFAHSPSRSRS